MLLQEDALFPESLRGNPGTIRQRLELEPGHLRIATRPADEGAEAAVSPCDHVLPADDAREGLDALRDEARMLDVIGERVDHARDQGFAVRNLGLLPDLPLVGVARV